MWWWMLNDFVSVYNRKYLLLFVAEEGYNEELKHNWNDKENQ